MPEIWRVSNLIHQDHLGKVLDVQLLRMQQRSKMPADVTLVIFKNFGQIFLPSTHF